MELEKAQVEPTAALLLVDISHNAVRACKAVEDHLDNLQKLSSTPTLSLCAHPLNFDFEAEAFAAP